MSCIGNAHCIKGNINTYELARKIEKIIFPSHYHIKVAVAGCPNDCVKANFNDFGVMGVNKQVYDIDLSTIQPIVAKPHFVDNVVPAKESLGVKIDEAFLGSCNNGRIEDLRVGAAIIKGKKVAPKVRFLVVPASRSVYLQAMKEGLLDIFMDAGAIVMNPNCSVCWGSCQGVIGEGETLISTGTRNFKGRAGHKDSFVYLASAATVTASAIKGEIATADMV